MKASLVILCLLMLGACATGGPRTYFYPAVGMTEAQVEAAWGPGGSSSTISTAYSEYTTRWYTRHMGGIMSGCSREVFRGNPFYFGCTAVHYRDGKVMAVSNY